jgi:methyl-accepting chemotaxis protein
MRFLNNLQIVLKVGLIVAVLGCALLGAAAFSAVQLSSTVDHYADLSATQAAVLNLTRAQRRAESYHAALYAILTEATDEGNARRLKIAKENRDSIAGFLDAAIKEDASRAGEIRAIGDKLKGVFAACDPVLEAGAKARTTEENAKAAARAHKECDPVMDVVLEDIAKFTAVTAEQVAGRKQVIGEQAGVSIRTVIGVSAVGLLVGVAIALFLGLKTMSQPIARLKLAMEGLARNHLATEVPEKDRNDEIGEMAKTVEVFKTNALEVERLKKTHEDAERQAAEHRRRDMVDLADGFERAVGEIIDTVGSASTELEASSSTLATTAQRAQELTSVVAMASGEATGNVQSVASATEELSSSGIFRYLIVKSDLLSIT